LGLELSMRPTIAVAIVLVLFLSGSAKGADLIQLAETGGFLLGNAYRCGVPTDRVEHAGQVIHATIAAVSSVQTRSCYGLAVYTNLHCQHFPGPRSGRIDPALQDGDRAVRTPRAASSANRNNPLGDHNAMIGAA
jgi:hypothetical protein